MSTAIEYAQNYVDKMLRESGPNRGPEINKMLKSARTPAGQPWCAAFVCYCFRLAIGNIPDFNSAGTVVIRNWFRRYQRYTCDPDAMVQWKGGLFGWTNEDGITGHIGFIRNRLTVSVDHKLEVVAIQTLEGNTNPGGSRNGDGAYSLRRAVPVDGRHSLWFLNTSGLTGGDWWT